MSVIKIRSKIKDHQLVVRIKYPLGTHINREDFENFSRKVIRGFLTCHLIRANVVEYSGPIGVSLRKWLEQPISRYDFFLIIEQAVDTSRKILQSGYRLGKMRLTLDDSFINESTRTLQLLYAPDNNEDDLDAIFRFLEAITYAVKPADQYDNQFASRFIYFLRGQNTYNPDQIEAYIRKEDRSIVDLVRSKYVVRSAEPRGEKPISVGNPVGAHEADFGTELLSESDDGTVLLNEQDDQETTLLSEEDDNETTLLTEEKPAIYPKLHRILTAEDITVNKPVFRLGKEKSYVDYFVYDNNAVSRNHADIITRNGRYYIKDLNSKNKTFVNEQTILPETEHEIFDGSHIKLGNEEFVFQTR